jgi:hypothetical protein
MRYGRKNRPRRKSNNYDSKEKHFTSDDKKKQSSVNNTMGTLHRSNYHTKRELGFVSD